MSDNTCVIFSLCHVPTAMLALRLCKAVVSSAANASIATGLHDNANMLMFSGHNVYYDHHLPLACWYANVC